MLHVPGGPYYERYPILRTFEFMATGFSAVVPVFGAQHYALQVTGVGATATTWDIRLEGTLDGVAWTQILQHLLGSGDGAVLFTGANRFPVEEVRINVQTLTLGGASAVNVTFMGQS